MENNYNGSLFVIPIDIYLEPENEDEFFNIVLTSYLSILVSDHINRLYNNTLSEEEFNKLLKINKEFECGICMEQKNTGIELDCNHLYCLECLKKWLTTVKKTCPTCRKEVGK